MIRVLTQFILTTLIMPITLIAGMLSFPSTCQCGAELPHDHSLFMLAGHSHLPGAHHHQHDTRKTTVTYDGPTVQLPAANASAKTEAAVMRPHELILSSERPAPFTSERQLSPGQMQTPELPPPQT